jgi:hypothetical protein
VENLKSGLEVPMTTLRKHGISVLPVLFLFLALRPVALAQSRMSDDDVGRTMRNLKEDSQRFQSTFNSAISKSTVRKTSQEKEYKNLVKSFRDQAEAMLNAFQDKKKADTTLPGALDTAKRIDTVLASVQLGGNNTADWARCKSELKVLAEAFGMPSPGN